MSGRVLKSFYGQPDQYSKMVVDSVVFLQLLAVCLSLRTVQAQVASLNETAVIALGKSARW